MSLLGNNAIIYGGKEVNAVVLDPGSFNTRLGYSGDDFPKIITLSCYSCLDPNINNANKIKRYFDESINVPKSNFNVHSIVSNSIIIDWDAALDQYSFYFDKVLNIDYKEQPILITEPVWTDLKYRQELVENFYEYFNFSALYLTKSPTCVSFQQGKTNCLIVDIGHDSASVTPVIDGISLLKNSMRTNYAGLFLNDQIHHLICTKKKVPIEPTYKIKNKIPQIHPNLPDFRYKILPDNITPSFEKHQIYKVWHEFKETMLEASKVKIDDHKFNSKDSNSNLFSQLFHKRLFELPNGLSVEVDLERYMITESLFNPLIVNISSNEFYNKYPLNNGELHFENKNYDYKPQKRLKKSDSNNCDINQSDAYVENNKSKSNSRGITELVLQTLSEIDIDLRSLVSHNIIVTGGVSLIPHLTERLHQDLSSSNIGLKIKLQSVGNSSERLNQSWIGGSILASLGTFHQMWVSQEEYHEVGPERILNQRFR